MIISDLNYLETVDVNLAGGWTDVKNIKFNHFPFPPQGQAVGVKTQVDLDSKSAKEVRNTPWGPICVWQPVVTIKLSCPDDPM